MLYIFWFYFIIFVVFWVDVFLKYWMIFGEEKLPLGSGSKRCFFYITVTFVFKTTIVPSKFCCITSVMIAVPYARQYTPYVSYEVLSPFASGISLIAFKCFTLSRVYASSRLFLIYPGASASLIFNK